MEAALEHDAIHQHDDDDNAYHDHDNYSDDDDHVSQSHENLAILGENDDNENYTKKVDEYFEFLQQACTLLSNFDGGYRGKLEAYIKKRNEESPLYREMTKIPTQGADGDLTEIHQLTNERRWRATTKVNGPAWKRYLQRNPPTKIRGLTDTEQDIVNKNMKDRALWGKIMKGIEDEREAKGLPPSMKEQRLIDLKNLEEAKFHLLRSIPTEIEQGKSLNRWHHGIFYPWDLEDSDTAFPYQLGIDGNVKPSLSVIKVDGKYVRHVEKDHSNNRYTHQNKHTSMKEGFDAHYRIKRLKQADEILAQALEKKRIKLLEKEAEMKRKKRLQKHDKVEKIEILTRDNSAEWVEEKADDDDNDDNNVVEEDEEGVEKQMRSTGFQQESYASFESSPPSIRSSPTFEIPFVNSLKAMSRSFLSFSRSKSEYEGPTFALVSLDKRKESLPQPSSSLEDQMNQQHHHHPGERPGVDAVEMMNDIAKEDAHTVNRDEAIQRTVSKKNEIRQYPYPLTPAGSERRTGKRAAGQRPYLDSPRRVNRFNFDWTKEVKSLSIRLKPHPAQQKSRSLSSIPNKISQLFSRQPSSSFSFSTSFASNKVVPESARESNPSPSPPLIAPSTSSAAPAHTFVPISTSSSTPLSRKTSLRRQSTNQETSSTPAISTNPVTIPEIISEMPADQIIEIEPMEMEAVVKKRSPKTTIKKGRSSRGQKFEVVGGGGGGDVEEKDKSKSGQKKSGIIRTNTAFATATTSETEKERKRREKKEKKQHEKEEKERQTREEREQELNQSQSLRTRLSEVLTRLRQLFTSNTMASRFGIQTEQSNQIDESVFSSERSPTDLFFIETLVNVRKAKIESKKRINQIFRLFFGGLIVPFDDDRVYTCQDLRREATHGRYENVVDILEHWSGLTPNNRCQEGDTPYYAAIMKCLEGVPDDDESFTVEFGLRAIWKKIKKLFSARDRRTGNLMIVMNVLDYYGGDVNVLKEDRDGGDGYSLLHQAAEKNLVQLCKWLSSRQVNVHLKTSTFQRTPLMLAAKAGNNEMMVRLLHMGAIDTINSLDCEGNSALHFAAAYCEPEYVQYLLVCGAEKSKRNQNNRLPFEEARVKGRIDTLLVLSAYKDRSHIRRPQIQYFHEEVKKGNTGAIVEKKRKQSSQSDNSSSFFNNTKSLMNNLTLKTKTLD